LHKQPLPLWCMAVCMKMFGICEWALRFPSLILSTLAVYLTYFIGKELFDEKTGLLAAFFHAINGLIIEITGGRIATDHIDIFFLFFVELAIVFTVLYYKRQKVIFNLFTGIAIGLAILCKWLPALVVLIIWLILNFNKRELFKAVKNILLILGTVGVVFMPWQIYARSTFPLEYQNEMMHNYRHIVEVLDGREGGLFYFFNKLFINVNEFIWVALFFFCYGLYKMDRYRNRLALVAWVIIPFLFFTVAKTKMQGYLLFTFPALFIMLAEFCIFLVDKKGNLNQIRLQKIIVTVIIFLSVRFCIERMKPLQDQYKQLAWANEFRKMEKTNADKRVYFNVAHCIEGMFYTNSIMYGYSPTPQQVEDLKSKGYSVIINQIDGL
jgi:4-amino-4-deoxy-L-arabinose transferase-like glycosyltransferase